MWKYNYSTTQPDELYHFGVLGMKWGKRKAEPVSDIRQAHNTAKANKKDYKQSDEHKQKVKTAAKVGAAAVGTALAAYGTYKASKLIKDKALQKSIKQGKDYAEIWSDVATRNVTLGSAAIAQRAIRDNDRYVRERNTKIAKSTVSAIKYLRDK